jgi:DNA anti-recombination protein RmuC
MAAAPAADLSQWAGVAISVVGMLGITAANLFFMGRFVGQWSEAMKNIVATIAKVEERVEAVEEQAMEVPLIDHRLAAAEAAISRFWELRDEFTALRVTVEQQGQHSREKLDSLARGQSVIERQMANLFNTRAGFTTLTSEDKN